MSLNGFARSRPQARHQRGPKKQCYAHPRFLQLVKELTRIDDAKKKQDELEQQKNVGSCAKTRSNVAINTVGTCTFNDDCSSPTTTSSQNTVLNHRPHHHQHHHHHHHHHHNHPHAPSIQSNPASNQQQPSVDCWPINVSLNGSSCCRNLSEAHSSTGCRSLECNQPSSALNDNYYRQSNIDNLPISNPSMHQNYQRHYGYTIDHQLVNNLNQPQNHDYRCPPSKCAPVSAPANVAANLGYTKPNQIDQNATDFSNSDSDPRQDENRSKRKRSSNDSSNASKKLSPTSPSSCSKRHKASPEPARPLSPSFTKCPICLLDCMDRDPSFTNTCFHLFCYVCIENWSKSKATCPLCRTKFTKIIYNIRSASCFDEKVASPIRREDDDDRIIYEQIQGLTATTIASARTIASNNDEARLLFDNLGANFTLLNHTLNARVSALQSFNPVTTNSNFNSSVPHARFTAANYNHIGPSYNTLFSSNDGSHAPASGPAITSAYAPNTSLTNSSSNSSNRSPARMPRSSRYIQQRNYNLTPIESSTRVNRSTNTDLNPSGISIETRHLHYPLPHGSHHQHHNQHNHQPQPQQHRSTSTIDLATSRPVQRMVEHPFPFLIQSRHFPDPHIYSRRSYINLPTDQNPPNSLYRPMPDM